jgi:SIR2-like domain
MGFDDEQLIEDDWAEEDWANLLADIDDKKCIPFIGSGASNKWIQLDGIVKEWVKAYRYPYSLDDSSQLPRVSQFVGMLKRDDSSPKKTLSRLLKDKAKSLPDFSAPEYENSVYTILADLHLPIYITTNYDRLMEKALSDKGKEPVSDYSKWKESMKIAFIESRPELGGVGSYHATDTFRNPTSANPLVFHLLGDIDSPTSMVLTEKDFIDFAIYLTRMGDKYVFPHSIRQNLSNATLLFVGYRLEDISFIIVFEAFIKLMSSLQSKSIAVQVQMPLEIEPEKRKAIRTYLNEFTESYFKIRIYWGDSNAFLQQLRNRWSNAKVAKK